ncbi:MAG TPA: hypothetical protein VMS89_10050 [Methanoregulaceae archaeon]|nr:hypothetical protein [Methanoregulaceae archaeon]
MHGKWNFILCGIGYSTDLQDGPVGFFTPGVDLHSMDLKDIPDTTKWQIASRLASRLPVMYDFIFRERIGAQYDELEQDIWIEIGKQSKEVAGALRLPLKTAPQVAEALRIISTIFFSADYTVEHLKIAEDRSVLRITRCPFIFREIEIRGSTGPVFSRCLTFAITSVEALNPEYTLRFVRSMCMGDKACEMKVVKKELVADEEQVPGTEK